MVSFRGTVAKFRATYASDIFGRLVLPATAVNVTVALGETAYTLFGDNDCVNISVGPYIYCMWQPRAMRFAQQSSRTRLKPIDAYAHSNMP